MCGFDSDFFPEYKSKSILGMNLHLNPLYTNEFFHLEWYNEVGIANCIYLGVSGYNFKKKYCIILSEDLFDLHKRLRHDEM